MPYPNEHSARLKDPGQYDEFRRQNDKFGAGIHAILGIVKGPPRKSELQAIRFDAGKFSVAEAKKWLKDHGHKPIAFEPAKSPEKDSDDWFHAAPRAQLFYRAETIRAASLNEDERTVEVTFSSEARVSRWFGAEILSHDASAVDLQRLRTVGAVLVNHDPHTIAGSIQQAWVGEDRRGHALIRFDPDEQGNWAMTKVASGSLRGTSVGYLVERYRDVPQDSEITFHGETIAGPAKIAVRWTPIEFSLTPIPADADVGIGRDATRSLDGIEIEQPVESAEEETEMDQRTRTYLEARGLDPGATEEQGWAHLDALQAEDAKRDAALKAATEPIGQISPMGPSTATTAQPAPTDEAGVRKQIAEQLAGIVERAASIGQVDLALKLAREGKSELAIAHAVIEAAAKERTAPLGQSAAQAAALQAVSDDDLARAICRPTMSLG